MSNVTPLSLYRKFGYGTNALPEGQQAQFQNVMRRRSFPVSESMSVPIRDTFRPLHFGDRLAKPVRDKATSTSPEQRVYERDLKPLLAERGLADVIALLEGARKRAKAMRSKEVTALHVLLEELHLAANLQSNKDETGFGWYAYNSIVPPKYTSNEDRVHTTARAFFPYLCEKTTELEATLQGGKAKSVQRHRSFQQSDPPFSQGVLQTLRVMLDVDFPAMAENFEKSRLREADRIRGELGARIQKLEEAQAPDNVRQAELQTLHAELAQVDAATLQDYKERFNRQQRQDLASIMFSEGLNPPFAFFPDIREARKFIQPIRHTLAERSGVLIQSEDEDLPNLEAASLGAKQPEQEVLNGFIGASKRAADKGDQGAYSQFRDLARIYSGTDWNMLRRKKVNLQRASKKLEANPAIPTEIRAKLLDFLAMGNTQGWTNAPMLLLDGTPGNDLLRQEICNTLASREILDVPVFDVLPSELSNSGPHDGSRLGLHKDGSPAVRAMLGLGTSHGLVRLKEVERFMLHSNMGEEFINAVAIPGMRKKYEDPHLSKAVDLSPMIWVGETGPNQDQNWGDAFWERRIRDGRSVYEINLDHTFTPTEKFAILRKVILPEMLKERGLTERQVQFDEEALKRLATDFPITGRLDEMKTLLGLILTTARTRLIGQQAAKEKPGIRITANQLEDFIGRTSHVQRNNKVTAEPTAGIAHMLTVFMPGSGGGGCFTLKATPIKEKADEKQEKFRERHITGPVGAQAKDSFQKMAIILTKAMDSYPRLKTDPNAYTLNADWTIYSDGPSAGAAMATAFISAITDIPYNPEVAMTGTMEMDGKVGNIGGEIEKIMMGAGRTGGVIKKVLVPRDNYQDTLLVRDKYPGLLDNIEIIPVDNLDQVLRHALTDYQKLYEPHPAPRKWPEWLRAPKWLSFSKR